MRRLWPLLILLLGCGSPGDHPPPEPIQIASVNDAREVYLLGLEHQDAEEWQKAVKAFQLALRYDPLLYKAHFKLGICYLQLGEYELEIVEYKKCLAANRSYAPAWRNLGNAYLARNEIERARDAYDHLPEKNPLRPD